MHARVIRVQEKKLIAVDQTVAETPGAVKSRASSSAGAPARDTALAETLESTGDDSVAEHGRLAKGSRADRGKPPTPVEVAPTIAAGSDNDEAHARDGQLAVQPGAHLGRLEIGETLGSGAFGVVVAAYDPELKRKLAVKILRPEVFDSTGGKDAQKRLMREARAMARISHPNVVTVHDIGTVDGQIFVAMEFVAGTHLRDWLTEKEHSWQDILAVFMQAGQGLAAAHREGLVHRDFKPDNVLVSDRGDVRVADFGLVSICSQKEKKIVSAEFAVPRTGSDELGITRVGAVMGTALYMAPEQHRGHEAGPAADQFAFCVALYWGLCDKAPFEGRNYEQLRDNVLAGRLTPPPASSTAPKWIWPILVKGMATDPASRHESMEALLTCLAHDPTRKRNARLKMAGLALLGAGAVGAFFMTRPAAVSVCQNAEDRLQGTWDAPTKARVKSAYTQANQGDGFARLEGAVDRYTGDWVTVRTRVCEATHFVGDQSNELLDLRMMCLDQRLGYLGQLMSHVAPGTDTATLDKAVTASMTLPGLEACTQRKSFSATMPLPADAEQRKAIAALSAAVDKARALSDLGQPGESAAILRAALATPVDYPPTMGDATNVLGKSLSDLGDLEEAEDVLNKSIEYSTVAGDDLKVASSWLALMHLVGVEREDYAAGYEMGRMARLAMVRGKADPFSMAGVEKSTAAILIREGKADEAIAILQSVLGVYQDASSESELAFFLAVLADAKAGDAQYEEAIVDYKLSLAHLESVLGPDHLENVYVLNNLSVSLKNTGKLEEAREALERSLVIVERTYGKVHRSVVTILINMGNLARRAGDFEHARAIFARAIDVGNEVLEEGHPSVTKAIMNLGIVLASEGDYEGATGRFLVVLERAKKSFDGADHPDVAMALNNVGESLSLEGKDEEGLQYVTEALEMKTRLYGADHPKAASSIATVGTVNAKLGRASEAEEYLQRALTIFVGAAGETHPRSIAMLSALGHLHVDNGAAKKAIPFLTRAIDARGEAPSAEQAKDRLALAQALWKSSDRAAATAQVTALQGLLADLEDADSVRESLEKWLRER